MLSNTKIIRLFYCFALAFMISSFGFVSEGNAQCACQADAPGGPICGNPDNPTDVHCPGKPCDPTAPDSCNPITLCNVLNQCVTEGGDPSRSCTVDAECDLLPPPETFCNDLDQCVVRGGDPSRPCSSDLQCVTKPPQVPKPTYFFNDADYPKTKVTGELEKFDLMINWGDQEFQYKEKFKASKGYKSNIIDVEVELDPDQLQIVNWKKQVAGGVDKFMKGESDPIEVAGCSDDLKGKLGIAPTDDVYGTGKIDQFFLKVERVDPPSADQPVFRLDVQLQKNNEEKSLHYHSLNADNSVTGNEVPASAFSSDESGFHKFVTLAELAVKEKGENPSDIILGDGACANIGKEGGGPVLTDFDLDGFYLEIDDCDDNDPTVYPDIFEHHGDGPFSPFCSDGKDNNCNIIIDDPLDCSLTE